MQNIENTPVREDENSTTQQQGNRNSSQQGQQNSPQPQQGYSNSTQQGGNQNAGQQADQSSTYRGQEGQEYDVDTSDAVNRQADYSGNSQRDIEDSTLDADKDMESQHDSDQNINPGDKAPNKDFNR
ncbi:hypothetical protein [Emticicia sp. BO119]|uniref:hypothetical protein n=1 Tax=Emticicia sp. BO119 TaxID=2757768 RepID=UPI0015F0482E|nr:hypothetical protein [Emticicia sp. BO119]MBA4849421.1 hypothetical protein [Emticicia sp. BO119]